MIFLLRMIQQDKSSKQVLHQLCIKIVWCSDDAGQNGIGSGNTHVDDFAIQNTKLLRVCFDFRYSSMPFSHTLSFGLFICMSCGFSYFYLPFRNCLYNRLILTLIVFVFAYFQLCNPHLTAKGALRVFVFAFLLFLLYL